MIRPFLPRICALALGCCALVVQHAQAINIDFSNVSNASITFVGTGDTFAFKDATSGQTGYDFKITDSSGLGDAIGLLGNLSGMFTIGAITTSGPLESASVTSTNGAFSVFDGTTSLTADVAWIDIYTLGSIGGINAYGSVNLTNVTYAGTNSDLQEMVTNSTTGTGTIAFQFIPARSLTQLTTDGRVYSTSYSGSVMNIPTPQSQVPEGGSAVALLGLSLMAIQGFRRIWRCADD